MFTVILITIITPSIYLYKQYQIKNYIKEEKLGLILADIDIMISYLDLDKNLDQTKINKFNKAYFMILSKHNIEHISFKNSLKYYLYKYSSLDKIINNTLDQLELYKSRM